MSVRSEVLRWAQRVVARKGAAPDVLLEVDSECGVDEAQAAFHKVARMAHPDLHRSSLTPDELELVTTAYARVAGAYQELRSQRMTTTRMRPLQQPAPASAARAGGAPIGRPTTGPIPATAASSAGAMVPAGPVAPSGGAGAGATGAMGATGGAGATGATGAMSSKALVYFRKAEMCLRRGDLRGAVLQLKLAIAVDPQSAFLRTALSEVEIEVRKQ